MYKVDKLKILLTGIGCPGTPGTAYSLKEHTLFGQDEKSETAGSSFVEKTFITKDLESLFGFVDVVIPQTTKQVNEYHNRQKVMSEGDILTANDKLNLYKIAKHIEVPVPETYLARSLNEFFEIMDFMKYPVVVKPVFGNGSRGVRVIHDKPMSIEAFLDKPDPLYMTKDDFRKIFQNEFKEMLVCDYLPGREYTIDCFYDGETFVAIPRERTEIRSGISFYTKVVLREDLIKYSRYLAEKLNLRYAFGFQFKEDVNGLPRLLECNPRVQGTMVTSVFAGFNIINNAVKVILGIK